LALEGKGFIGNALIGNGKGRLGSGLLGWKWKAYVGVLVWRDMKLLIKEMGKY